MSDSIADFPAGSALRAVRFPTTVRAVRFLGGPRLPLSFVMVVDAEQVTFVDSRDQAVLWKFPVAIVQSVSVAETRSSPPYPRVSLAIVVKVRTDVGLTELPIVPVSDDGKRSMTWSDADVAGLAKRLSDSMKLAPSVN